MADVEEALDGNVVVSSFILGDDDRTMWVPCLRQMVRAQSAPSQMKQVKAPHLSSLRWHREQASVSPQCVWR